MEVLLQRQGAAGGRAVVGFAKDGDPPYALYVHEDREKRHAPPTQAGFLLTAAQRVQGRIPKIVADHVRRKIKRS